MSNPCMRCHTVLDEGDLRCAVCALPVPVIEHKHYRTVYPEVLRCTECAAAITFVPAARAPCCAFCGATMAIEQPHDPIERAERRVPFGVSRTTAEAVLRGWFATRGWFVPRALRTEAVTESLAPIYWSAWFVTAQATVAWAADSDHDARRSAWAPHSGETTLRFDSLCIPASRGLTHDECAYLAPSYDLSQQLPIGDELPEDGVVEAFEAQRSAARAAIQAALDAQAAARVRSHIPGTRIRNLHVASMLESQLTDRLALPAWIVTYRYRDRRYRAIVHGQRPDVVVGKTPLDVWQVLAALAVVAVVLAVLVLLSTGA